MKGPKIILFLVLLLLGLALAGSKLQRKTQIPIQVSPTPTLSINPPKIITVDSSDGMFILTLTTRPTPDGNLDQTLKTTDKTKDNVWLLYETVSTPTTQMSLPVNSWSPDNQQIFLLENGPNETKYLVFKADGNPYPDGQKYLDIGSYWAKSKNSYAIKDVTGWASNDLLVVSTTKTDGTTGPSFWFITSTKKFLQLRTI